MTSTTNPLNPIRSIQLGWADWGFGKPETLIGFKNPDGIAGPATFADYQPNWQETHMYNVNPYAVIEIQPGHLMSITDGQQPSDDAELLGIEVLVTHRTTQGREGTFIVHLTHPTRGRSRPRSVLTTASRFTNPVKLGGIGDFWDFYWTWDDVRNMGIMLEYWGPEDAEDNDTDVAIALLAPSPIFQEIPQPTSADAIPDIEVREILPPPEEQWLDVTSAERGPYFQPVASADAEYIGPPEGAFRFWPALRWSDAARATRFEIALQLEPEWTVIQADGGEGRPYTLTFDGGGPVLTPESLPVATVEILRLDEPYDTVVRWTIPWTYSAHLSYWYLNGRIICGKGDETAELRFNHIRTQVRPF